VGQDCSWGEQQGGSEHSCGCHALVKADLSPLTSLWACEPREDSSCHCCIIGSLHCDLNPDLKFAPSLMELGRRIIERAGICDHLACRWCWLRLCSHKGCDMILEVDLPLNELTEECIKVCHSELVWVEMGVRGRSLFNWLEA